MKRWTLIALILTISFAASCASKEAQRAPSSAAETDEAAASESAAAPREDREQVVVGVEDLVQTNNEFAFDLYKSLRADNTVISPHGVATTLAIAHAGAENATATEIQKVLRAKLGERDLHQKFSQLHTALRQREAKQARNDRRGFRLRVVNGVWHSPRLQPEPGFLRIATGQHFAQLEALDFASDPEGSREKINTFVSDATASKIEQVIKAGEINAITRLILTNSVYFDAPWTVPFDRASTQDGVFHAPAGDRKVPMMHNTDRFGYFQGDGFQALELPYTDGTVVATLVLPSPEQPDFDGTITTDYFSWMLSQMRQSKVSVSIPRFELSQRYELKATLKSMGMSSSFDPATADFGGLASSEEPIFIDEIIHQTYIRVDEEGTEAAAATVVMGGAGGIEEEPPVFVADRPFLFIVRDVPTGAILFMARVTEP